MIVTKRRAVHVGFWSPNVLPIAKIDAIFDEHGEWARYNRYNWIIFTTSRLITIREQLRALPGLDKVNIFLCECIRRPMTSALAHGQVICLAVDGEERDKVWIEFV